MNTSRIVRWVSVVVCCTLVFGLLSSAGAVSQIAQSVPFPPLLSPESSSLLFVENVGQFPEGVRFLAYGSNQGRLWLTENALWVMIDGEGQSAAIRLTFPGANPRPEPFGLRETVFNYYHGNDPSRWYARVPVWSGVRYVNLYPGVDLEITGNGNDWSWRLIPTLSPSPSQGEGWGGGLRLRVEGTNEVEILPSPNSGRGAGGEGLRLSTAAGEVTLPLISMSGGAPEGQSVVVEAERNIFEVASPFAPPIPNLQSPQDNPDRLLYSTFLGAEVGDGGYGLAVNSAGEAYLTGITFSPDFPTTPGAYDPTLTGDMDIFVTRLNPTGSSLVWSTFIGGDETTQAPPTGEFVRDIAVDSGGAVYICGETTASDFPVTAGAFDTTYENFGPFVVKLNSAGGLAYSTFLPSFPPPEVLTVNAIAVDTAGMIYITGFAWETLPTTPGAYDRTFNSFGSAKTYVIKLNPAGQGQADLLYGTYVGGTGWDFANDIAVDSAGIVYVIGQTEGRGYVDEEFPTTPGAYDTTFNGELPPPCCPIPTNVFFYKLNPAGNGVADLLYSTYLGGVATINEWGLGVAVDAAGMVYLTGSTWAVDFPTTTGAFDTVYAGYGDAFVSKLNPAGNGAADLLYSTYLGGWWIDNGGRAIAVDDNGDIYIVGDTYSSDFPVTPDAYQTDFVDYTDLFVTRLRPQGNGQADGSALLTTGLVYSTFLGGDYLDYGYGLAVGQEETVYIAGFTNSADFPTTAGAYDTTFGSGMCNGIPCYDAFAAKLSVKPSYIITGTVTNPEGQPILGVQVFAGEGYQGATNTSGEYTITDPEPGVYVLTPKRNGYFFSPATRTVTIPPSATGQDFTGIHILKESEPPPGGVVHYGEVLTYSVQVAFPNAQQMVLHDLIPNYTAYLSDTLTAPIGIFYDPASNTISGTLDIVTGTPVSVTFAVRVEVEGSADFAPLIANRACIYPASGTMDDCIWSDEIRHYTYLEFIYLPVIMK